MAVLEWDHDKYTVKNFLIDSHHKKLFDILNRIYELMAKGADDENIIKILSELRDYTNYHFTEEEKMMEKINYPDLFNHQKEHKLFIAKIDEFYNDAKNGKAIFVAVKVADTGIEWLKKHILTIDAKYQHYIEVNNISV